jgi:hypothetical protein
MQRPILSIQNMSSYRDYSTGRQPADQAGCDGEDEKDTQ